VLRANLGNEIPERSQIMSILRLSTNFLQARIKKSFFIELTKQLSHC